MHRSQPAVSQSNRNQDIYDLFHKFHSSMLSNCTLLSALSPAKLIPARINQVFEPLQKLSESIGLKLAHARQRNTLSPTELAYFNEELAFYQENLSKSRLFEEAFYAMQKKGRFNKKITSSRLMHYFVKSMNTALDPLTTDDIDEVIEAVQWLKHSIDIGLRQRNPMVAYCYLPLKLYEHMLEGLVERNTPYIQAHPFVQKQISDLSLIPARKVKHSDIKALRAALTKEQPETTAYFDQMMGRLTNACHKIEGQGGSSPEEVLTVADISSLRYQIPPCTYLKLSEGKNPALADAIENIAKLDINPLHYMRRRAR